MKRISLAVLGFGAMLSLSGCGGGQNSGSNTGGSAEQTLNFGPLTTRVAGTAQQPVTSGGSGSTITGIAGATISSMTLTQPNVTLSQTKIAFNSSRDGNYEIYIMNGDGTNQTRLTNNPAGDFQPSISPDGTKIAFSSDRDGNTEIYTMNADGTNQTRLTNNTTGDGSPTWSPDGAKIAFESKRDGKYQIYTMNADGTSQTRLTSNSANDNSPAWSPDGTKIAFCSDRDGNNEIYVMNADGTSQTRLTNNSATDINPAWSPNSSKISFLSTRDGSPQVYVMIADGTGQTRLTDTASFNYYSSWSPDGTKLVFQSKRAGGILSQLFTMNSNGSNVTQLTSTTASGESENPNWSPATTLKRSLIGTGGSLGTTAAGFLYGRNGDAITSLLTFDTPAASRSSARATTTTGIASGLSNYSFTVTSVDQITSLAYTNDVYGTPTSVISSGTPNVSSAIVDYNAATGKVIAVLPFASNRAAAPQATQHGETHLYRGQFIGVWDSAGHNLAPQGAQEVSVDTQANRVQVVR